MFTTYIGIDYSGAGRPDSGLTGLAVSSAEPDESVKLLKIQSTQGDTDKWSRKGIYRFLCKEMMRCDKRILIGIDHGFSYPQPLLEDMGLRDWDAFLGWFRKRWKTARYSVSECKKQGPYQNSAMKRLAEEEFTSSAKSVVDLDRAAGMQGAVSYSTHAGLAWIVRLRRLQRMKRLNIHFWPFDGFEIHRDAHVIVEAYPSIYKKRVSLDLSMNEHEQDASVIAGWMRDRDRDDTLRQYLMLPTLNESERQRSEVEGWILGCL